MKDYLLGSCGWRRPINLSLQTSCLLDLILFGWGPEARRFFVCRRSPPKATFLSLCLLTAAVHLTTGRILPTPPAMFADIISVHFWSRTPPPNGFSVQFMKLSEICIAASLGCKGVIRLNGCAAASVIALASSEVTSGFCNKRKGKKTTHT